IITVLLANLRNYFPILETLSHSLSTIFFFAFFQWLKEKYSSHKRLSEGKYSKKLLNEFKRSLQN
ncbi:MAG: hypothetical protein ACK56I_12845, partial [bacterium]